MFFTLFFTLPVSRVEIRWLQNVNWTREFPFFPRSPTSLVSAFAFFLSIFYVDSFDDDTFCDFFSFTFFSFHYNTVSCAFVVSLIFTQFFFYRWNKKAKMDIHVKVDNNKSLSIHRSKNCLPRFPFFPCMKTFFFLYPSQLCNAEWTISPA